MDTDDLSNEAYAAVLLTAESFNHDLAVHFGCLADVCKNEKEYLLKAEHLINECLEDEDIEYLMEDIFFGNPPGEKDFKKTLSLILHNINKVRQIPKEKMTFAFKKTMNRKHSKSKAIKSLSRDPVMKKLIGKYGELTLSESKDYFTDLARTIVGQQLSGKAAATIWKRVAYLAGDDVTEGKIISIPDEALRQAGVSSNKTKYLKNLAQAIIDKSLNIENIQKYDDEEIIRQLTAIKGVGRWTAEMFLIFSLAREDVFSLGDGGLNNAVNRLYGNGAALGKDEISKIAEKWKPYRSIASLYLWRSLDNK